MYHTHTLKPLIKAMIFVAGLTISHQIDQSIEFNAFTIKQLAAQDAEDRILTVMYSYEKWNKDGEKRFVLVPQPIAIKKGEAKDRFRELYQALKDSKASTYGDVKFQAEGDVVYIFLDEAKSNLHPIVVAETTYTFTENGAKAVEFPKSKFAGKGYTRQDIRYPAYQLTFPFHEVLPPKTAIGVLVSLPDGSFLGAEQLKQGLIAKDSRLVAQVNEALKSGIPQVVEAILNAQETLKLPISEGLMPLLNSANDEVRILAIKGLKGDDRAEINVALRKVMDEDPSDQVKDEAAAALSQSKDLKFAESAAFHALRSKDPKVARQAAQGLINAKSKEATAELLNALKNSDADVKVAACEALVARKEFKALSDQLNGGLDVASKLTVALALTQLKQEAFSFTALQFVLENGNLEQAQNASKDLLSYGKNPRLVEVLALGLKNKEKAVRRAAAFTLSQVEAKLGKSAILALSQEKLDDEQIGNAVGLAMQTLYVKLGFAEVSKDLNSSTEALKLKATAALGQLYLDPKEKKNQAKILAELDKAVNQSNVKLKAEAAMAYGEMGGDIAKAALINLSKLDAIEVKRMVAYGFGFFPEEVGLEFLNKQLGESDVILLVNTMKSIAKIKSVKAGELLIDEKYLNHEKLKVRRAATKALAELAELFDKKKQGLLISLLGARLEGDSDLKVKINAANGLGHVKADTAIDILTPSIQTEQLDLKLTIVQALINHNSSSAVKSLELAIEDKDESTRAKVLTLLDKISSPEAKTALKELLLKRKDKESNTQIKASIEKILSTL